MKLFKRFALLFLLLIISGNFVWAEDANDPEEGCPSMAIPKEEIISGKKVSMPDDLLDRVKETMKDIEQEQAKFTIEYKFADKLSKKAAKKIKKRMIKEKFVSKKKIKLRAKKDVQEDYFLEITVCLLEEAKPSEVAAVPPGEGCPSMVIPKEEIISGKKVSMPDDLLDRVKETMKDIEQEQAKLTIEYKFADKLSKKAAKKIKKRMIKKKFINKKKIKLRAKKDVQEDYFLEITVCPLEGAKPPEVAAVLPGEGVGPPGVAGVPPGEGVGIPEVAAKSLEEVAEPSEEEAKPSEEAAEPSEEAAEPSEEVAEAPEEPIGPKEPREFISDMGITLGYIKNRDYLSSFTQQLSIGLRLPRWVPKEMFFGLDVGYYGGSDSGRESFRNSADGYNDDYSLKVIPIILSVYWEIKQLVVKLPHVGLLTPFAGAGLGPYLSKFDYDYKIPDYSESSGGGWDGSFGLQTAAGAFARYKSWEFSLDLRYSYAAHNSGDGVEGKIGGFSINAGASYIYGFSL